MRVRECNWYWRRIVNCRHHYYPFVEGVMEPTYSKDDLEAMKGENRKFTFEGKEYDGYTSTQAQRRIERTIRKLKREQTAYKAAGLEEDAQAVTARIRRLNQEYKAFSEAAGLPLQRERMRILYE
ncbi:MAG: phage minor capsid protein [Faecalispora jeddahensis]